MRVVWSENFTYFALGIQQTIDTSSAFDAGHMPDDHHNPHQGRHALPYPYHTGPSPHDHMGGASSDGMGGLAALATAVADNGAPQATRRSQRQQLVLHSHGGPPAPGGYGDSFAGYTYGGDGGGGAPSIHLSELNSLLGDGSTTGTASLLPQSQQAHPHGLVHGGLHGASSSSNNTHTHTASSSAGSKRPQEKTPTDGEGSDHENPRGVGVFSDGPDESPMDRSQHSVHPADLAAPPALASMLGMATSSPVTHSAAQAATVAAFANTFAAGAARELADSAAVYSDRPLSQWDAASAAELAAHDDLDDTVRGFRARPLAGLGRMRPPSEAGLGLGQPAAADAAGVRLGRASSDAGNGMLSPSAQAQKDQGGAAEAFSSKRLLSYVHNVLSGLPGHFTCADVWFPATPRGGGPDVLTHAGMASIDDSCKGWEEYSSNFTFQPNAGVPGRVFSTRAPEWHEDITKEQENIFHRLRGAKRWGLKGLLGVPIFGFSGKVIPCVFYSMTSFEEKVPQSILDTLKHAFATSINVYSTQRIELMYETGGAAAAAAAAAAANPNAEASAGGGALYAPLPGGMDASRRSGHSRAGEAALYQASSGALAMPNPMDVSGRSGRSGRSGASRSADEPSAAAVEQQQKRAEARSGAAVLLRYAHEQKADVARKQLALSARLALLQNNETMIDSFLSMKAMGLPDSDIASQLVDDHSVMAAAAQSESTASGGGGSQRGGASSSASASASAASPPNLEGPAK